MNLVGNSCGFAYVVCKWVCRGVGQVSASYVFRSGVSGDGCLVHALCLFVGRSVVQVYGVNREVFLMGFRRVIVFSMGPYSC